MTSCNLRSIEYIDDSIRISLGVINAVSGFLAFFGNLVIIVVIFNHNGLRTRPNHLICFLALADLLVGLVIQPILTARLVLQPLWSNCFMADIVTYIGSVLCGASACILSVISYDRYLHIVQWQTYLIRMSRRKFSILIALCWIIPIIGSIFSLFLSTRRVYYIILTATAISVALCIAISYKKIYSFLRRKRKVFQSNQVPRNANTSELARFKNNFKLAKSFAIVIGCFIICWLPVTIFSIYVAILDLTGNAVAKPHRTLVAIRYIVVTLGMFNSSINPLIYFWRNKALRASTKTFLLDKICR